MVKLIQSETGYSIGAPDFRLEFQWNGERWVHELVFLSAGGFSRVAQSFESDPGRDDPRRVVSPTYQQLETQDGPEGQGALLLGQFGPHHFSAVFAVRDHGQGVEVKVDVADRCRAPLDALASTYTVFLPSGDLIEAAPERVVWAPNSTSGTRLQFDGLGSSRVVIAEGGRQGIRVQADAKIDPSTSTQRCIYRWHWLRPAPDGAAPVLFSAP